MALQEGGYYTLQILDTWKDAKGQPLKRPFRKTFQVSAPDIESPNLENWKLTIPKANSKSALKIEFPEALDEALLRRVLIVLDSSDREIEGSIGIDKGEKRWSFKPSQAWSVGAYRVQIQTILEDLAGNSLGRPFELEMRRGERHLRPPRYSYLDFKVE